MITKNITTIKDDVIEISSTGELSAVFIGKDKDSFERKMQFIVTHPNLDYKVTIKAVLWDESVFDLEALLTVDHGAANTNTYLKIDCLVMSERARARVVPGLEIMEDSVKSGHGATVSQVNPHQIEYLMSRGLTKHQAENLVVEGFLK